jgi:hypothetical protein
MYRFLGSLPGFVCVKCRLLMLKSMASFLSLYGLSPTICYYVSARPCSDRLRGPNAQLGRPCGASGSTSLGSANGIAVGRTCSVYSVSPNISFLSLYSRNTSSHPFIRTVYSPLKSGRKSRLGDVNRGSPVPDQHVHSCRTRDHRECAGLDAVRAREETGCAGQAAGCVAGIAAGINTFSNRVFTSTSTTTATTTGPTKRYTSGIPFTFATNGFLGIIFATTFISIIVYPAFAFYTTIYT